MTNAQLWSAAAPSILGLLSTPRTGDLYSLWFKVRGAPDDPVISQTGFHSVVAQSDFEALKSAFGIVNGTRPKWHRRGMKLLGFKLVRENNRVDSGKGTP